MDGHFRMDALTPGTHVIRVRQIGFKPTQLMVRVAGLQDAPLAASSGYVFQLARLPLLLDTVVVVATQSGSCRGRGFSQADASPRVAAILGALRENVDRYREVARQYPVLYRMQRIKQFTISTGANFTERSDTADRRTDVRWPYKAGAVFAISYAEGSAPREAHMPSVADVAEDAFQDSHCFRYAGVERVDGVVLHRIDFSPTAELRGTTDVEGSLYIDPGNYVLRRSVFRLTRLPDNMTVKSVETITSYKEIYPSVVIPEALRSEEWVRGIRIAGAKVTEFIQSDHLLSYHFVGEDPGAVMVGHR
jgi:hypothetical protein